MQFTPSSLALIFMARLDRYCTHVPTLRLGFSVDAAEVPTKGLTIQTGC